MGVCRNDVVDDSSCSLDDLQKRAQGSHVSIAVFIVVVSSPIMLFIFLIINIIMLRVFREVFSPFQLRSNPVFVIAHEGLSYVSYLM